MPRRIHNSTTTVISKSSYIKKVLRITKGKAISPKTIIKTRSAKARSQTQYKEIPSHLISIMKEGLKLKGPQPKTILPLLSKKKVKSKPILKVYNSLYIKFHSLLRSQR
jgi:hypothetical protein